MPDATPLPPRRECEPDEMAAFKVVSIASERERRTAEVTEELRAVYRDLRTLSLADILRCKEQIARWTHMTPARRQIVLDFVDFCAAPPAALRKVK